MTFYEKISSLCAQKGCSLTRLTEELDMSRSATSRWKSGAIPQAHTLKKIADYFGITPEQLLSNDTTVQIGTVHDNHGVIGKADTAVAICEEGSYTSALTAQEAELLTIFRSMSVLDQARMLIYASDLTKKKG